MWIGPASKVMSAVSINSAARAWRGQANHHATTGKTTAYPTMPMFRTFMLPRHIKKGLNRPLTLPFRQAHDVSNLKGPHCGPRR